MRILIIGMMLGVFIGCVGPLVPVVKMDKLSPEERHATLSLPIYNEGQLAGKKYNIINVVEGISCKNKTWDSAATKSDAINQTKYWARQQGANGILNVQCEVPRGTTTTYNCWESITCTAQAIMLTQ
ncbi:MAG: hypothetical protein EHM80_13040 [Nitrospiraceae bacterium]|nr:MAG: hypothetical protein EHM80_13040 [Nitrospiraceae bacterium]